MKNQKISKQMEKLLKKNYKKLCEENKISNKINVCKSKV
jgi:hypothetical protein